MTRLARSEGFTLVELLLAATLFLVVIGATLASFSRFEANTRINQQQQDAQARTREAVDRLARDLRNVGSNGGTQAAFDKVTSSDIVFTTTGSTGAVSRVRYCYDAAAERIWRQVNAPPAAPALDACPKPTWGTATVIAENVKNGATSGRQLFTACAVAPCVASEVRGIRVRAFVDVNAANRAPAESRLESGIFLRNQKRRPVAQFLATPGAARLVRLNGSSSYDADGERLEYTWYDLNKTTGTAAAACPTGSPVSCVGRGITFDYTAPASGTRNFQLSVCGPPPGGTCPAENLASTTKAVTVP